MTPPNNTPQQLLFIFNPFPNDNPTNNNNPNGNGNKTPSQQQHVLYTSHPSLHSLSKGPILTSYSMFHDVYGIYPNRMFLKKMGSGGIDVVDRDGDDNGHMNGGGNGADDAKNVYSLTWKEIKQEISPHHHKKPQTRRILYCFQQKNIFNNILKLNPQVENLSSWLDLKGAQRHLLPHEHTAVKRRHHLAESSCHDALDSILSRIPMDSLSHTYSLMGAFLLDLTTNEVLVTHLNAEYTRICVEHLLVHQKVESYRGAHWKQMAPDMKLVHQFLLPERESTSSQSIVSMRPVKKRREILQETAKRRRQSGVHQDGVFDEPVVAQPVQLMALIRNDLVLGALVSASSGDGSEENARHGDPDTTFETTQQSVFSWMKSIFPLILREYASQQQQQDSYSDDSDSSTISLPDHFFAFTQHSHNGNYSSSIINPDTTAHIDNFSSLFDHHVNLLVKMMKQNRKRSRCILKNRQHGIYFVAHRGADGGIVGSSSKRCIRDDLQILACSRLDAELESQLYDAFLGLVS